MREYEGFVLRREGDGYYVAPSGSAKSYSPYLHAARVYKTRAEAEADRCGNERVQSITLRGTRHA